ncbi:MAG TPA: LamG domain-containing protein [Anaerolineae bacterium]|nr:LamG domain-containing protein [Anaerolineae bacterium]
MAKDDLVRRIDITPATGVAIGGGAIMPAGDADTVDGFHASSTPTPGLLLALDANGQIPVAAIPTLDHGSLSGLGDNDHTQYLMSAGAGLNVASQTVALNTPGTLSAATINDATGNHVHQIAASSNPGAAEALLKSTAAGGLTLESLGVNGALTVDRDFTVGANVLFVDESQGNVGINCAPDPQFDLDVAGNFRAQGWIVGKHAIQVSDALMICHYDGPEPFETDFTGNATGHMGQVAVEENLYYRPGKFGKAVVIAEAATNLARNPITETGTTYWDAISGASVSRSGEHAYIGNYSLRAAPDDTQAYSGTSQSTAAGLGGSSQDYTIQCRIYLPSGGADVDLWARAIYTDGTFDQYGFGADLVSAADEWQWWKISFITSASKTLDYITLFARRPTTGDASPFYLDAVQIENRAYPTPFFYGDMPGCSWSGTAHASTSSRSAGTLKYDKATAWPGLSEGTFMARVWLPDWDNCADYPRVFQIGLAGHSTLYWQASTQNFRFGIGGTLGSSTAQSLSGRAHVALTWDSSAVKLYINGSLDTTLGAPGSSDDGDGYLYIGNRQAGDRHWNGLIDEGGFISRALSADEIRAIYESNAPIFAETSTWSWRSPSNLVWADSEGLWAVDEDGNAAFAVCGVDGKSWGGLTLDRGDVLIGDSDAHIRWDVSEARIILRGTMVQTPTSPSDAQAYSFVASDGHTTGALWAMLDSSDHYMHLGLNPESGRDHRIWILARSPSSGYSSRVDVSALNSAETEGAEIIALRDASGNNRAYIQPRGTEDIEIYFQGKTFITGGGLSIGTYSAPVSGAILMDEISTPTAPPSNHVVWFARDNGSGKTQLCARFPTGAVQVIATEP